MHQDTTLSNFTSYDYQCGLCQLYRELITENKFDKLHSKHKTCV